MQTQWAAQMVGPMVFRWMLSQHMRLFRPSDLWTRRNRPPPNVRPVVCYFCFLYICHH